MGVSDQRPGRAREATLAHSARRPLGCWVGGYQRFDSLGVDSAGNVCVATLINGGITVISPDGTSIEHIPMPDLFTTNSCFGGPDLRTAYVTLSNSGRLVAIDWPRPRLALTHLDQWEIRCLLTHINGRTRTPR